MASLGASQARGEWSSNLKEQRQHLKIKVCMSINLIITELPGHNRSKRAMTRKDEKRTHDLIAIDPAYKSKPGLASSSFWT